MSRTLTTGLSAALLLSLNLAAHAQNPEDDPIPDEDTPVQPVPAKPAPPKPAPPQATPPKADPKPAPAHPTPPAPVQPQEAPDDTPDAPTDGTPDAATENPDEAVTLTRSQLNALLKQQAELQRQIDELRRGNAAGTTTNPAAPSTGEDGAIEDNDTSAGTPATPNAGNNSGTDTPTTSGPTAGAPSGGNNALLLPDISFIGNALGLYSSDKRAEDRSSFRLSEGEIGIQGYVYPGVKVDSFITGSPAEDEAFQLEEGYLTFIGARPGLNIYAGRKFAPFGRTGEQHPHSWLYSRQLLPRRDLIGAENLTGDGVNFRYNRPFGKLYTQADFGIFAGEGAGETALDDNGNFDPAKPFGDGVPTGTGAGFTRRFYNSRLYAALPVGANSEFALGGSYARGRSEIDGLGNGNSAIYGLDATYRSYLSGGRRILARSEYFGYNPGSGLGTSKASGYYGLLNYRFQPNKDIGLLYEKSGFPQSPGKHENATSLIYTKQFTEQFYARLQGSHGRRPGDGSYNEILLQFVFGLGPHTHSLE